MSPDLQVSYDRLERTRRGQILWFSGDGISYHRLAQLAAYTMTSESTRDPDSWSGLSPEALSICCGLTTGKRSVDNAWSTLEGAAAWHHPVLGTYRVEMNWDLWLVPVPAKEVTTMKYYGRPTPANIPPGSILFSLEAPGWPPGSLYAKPSQESKDVAGWVLLALEVNVDLRTIPDSWSGVTRQDLIDLMCYPEDAERRDRFFGPQGTARFHHKGRAYRVVFDADTWLVRVPDEAAS